MKKEKNIYLYRNVNVTIYFNQTTNTQLSVSLSYHFVVMSKLERDAHSKLMNGNLVAYNNIL